MASLKKLAGQTAWYGISSIVARSIVFLLNPYLARLMTTSAYGEMGILYAAIPFMNVIFTYGMETAYFRFSNKDDNNEKHVFNIGSISLLFTTVIFTALLIICRVPLAQLLRVEEHPEFITWAACIIGMDALSALPFAKLRNQGRPKKYAAINVVSVLVYIVSVAFFYSVLPGIAKNNPGSFIASWYYPNLGVGYVLIANILQSASKLLLLLPEFLSVRFEVDKRMWKEMLIYSAPLIIAGFGGVINETFDRVMLSWWSSAPTEQAKKAEVGIYNACYKLTIIVTLFVQAFRMGAEPFFFQQAKGEDAPKTYARVMKFFVMTICTMFLLVTLYIDVWKYFAGDSRYWEGLRVVPILLVANMCLGVYYNVAIWYKLSHKTNAGATITVIGAIITLVINYTFIPRYGYMACAWATLACYASMMLISFIWGQKVYPVPYAFGKLLGYFGGMLALYLLYRLVGIWTADVLTHYITATVLLIVYVFFMIQMEKTDLKRLPLLNRLIK